MTHMLLLQERGRIARNIHDAIGYSLTNSLVGIETAIHLLDKDPIKAKQYLKIIKNTLQQGLRDVRETIYTIQDDQPTYIEFLPAIRFLLKQTEWNTGVRIMEDLPTEPLPLHSVSEMAIYRMIQEGLTNGIRHGKCTLFRCSISIEETSVIVILEDNGVGFNTNQPYEGFGLRSMKERIEEVGGQFTVSSKRHAGTILMAVLPENLYVNGEI